MNAYLKLQARSNKGLEFLQKNPDFKEVYLLEATSTRYYLVPTNAIHVTPVVVLIKDDPDLEWEVE